MLILPDETAEGEARRVPFGTYSYNSSSKAFVRDWEDLGHGFFLINYTNAKSGKGVYRYAIVRQSLLKEWDSIQQAYVPMPDAPTWEPVATVNKGKVAGEDAFRITVFRQDAPTDWAYPWFTHAAHEDREAAKDLMIGFWKVTHGIQ